MTFTPLFQMKGALTFVAEMRGQTVACGAGLIIAEHKVVALFGAAALPAFRGRGLQTALLRLRMGVAAEAGCDVAVIVTKGGTTSNATPNDWVFALPTAKRR